MKPVLNRIVDCIRVLFVLLMMLPFLTSCRDEVIPTPPPTIELHNGYSTQLSSLSNNVEWESDNPSVATVSSTGLVTAVGAGSATIYTYSSSSNEQVLVCYLEVHPRRNILFYIGAGENGIDLDAPNKINQIRESWQPGLGEMVIYIDRVQQGAGLLRVNEAKGDDGLYGLDTLDVYGAENSADSEVLSRVINTFISGHPADSYGMIFFSHGSGWLPEGTLNRPRSLVIDNNNGGGKTNREMEYYDFAAAIPDKQFDFIILEACLMADVMSMYELRNKAEYVLASSAEIVAPGFGGTKIGFATETYKKEIMRLYDTKSQIPSIVTDFAQSYFDDISAYPETNYRNSATLSLIKMSEMENLALAKKAALQGVSIEEANLSIDGIQSFDRPNALSGQRRSRYFDLADVMENIVPEAHYKLFNDQLEKTVVWKVSTKWFFYGESGVYSINKHSGLMTYIEQDVFPYLNSAYRNSSWYKAIY